MMKLFPGDKLKPQEGILQSRLFENKFTGIPPTLFYEIIIHLEPFDIENETYDTCIHLGFIQLNISGVNELNNKEFEFPVNPETGYIDGSMYLFNVHNPVDVTKIAFGRMEKGKIATRIYFNIDLEFECTGYANLYQQSIEIDLSLNKLLIDRDIIEGSDANLIKAKELVATFTDIHDFEEPENDEGDIIFRYK